MDQKIKQLENSLGIELPDEITSLYSKTDGEKDRGDRPWRLLSIAEATGINNQLAAEKILPREIRLFWSDDEGNFAGLYFKGPLAGRICFFDHEERDFAPRYDNIPDFLQAIAIAAKEGKVWREMPPKLSPGLDQLQKLRAQFASEDNDRKRRQLAFDIIAHTPPAQAADIIPFLDDRDLHVQERAAETLGKLQFHTAIPKLIEVAERETTRIHNARIASILALGKMKAPNGFDILMNLAVKIPTPFAPYIIGALKEHGVPTKLENGRWLYQHNKEWRSL